MKRERTKRDDREQPARIARGGRREMKKNQATDLPEVMTLSEVAKYLHCHSSTLYRLVTRGEIKGFRLGSDWRFRGEDVALWIGQQHQRASQAGEMANKSERRGRRKK